MTISGSDSAGTAAQATPRGLSIVVCFNDPFVREECLDRSLKAYSGAVDIDYIPVDNVTQDFTSAGAALNHGARQARHDVIVYVHQDVYLHSIDRLAEAARYLGDEWGMLGSCGVSLNPRHWRGRTRDRLELIGETCRAPGEVDTLDELLFMLRREDALAEPLSEDPDLAWHAYAVEYGARTRAGGRKVGAIDCAATHNSMTANLARLDVAHRRVAALHPSQMPLATTCGDIAVEERQPLLAAVRPTARWLRDSARAARLRRSTGLKVLLTDLRHTADMLEFSAEAPLRVLNFDPFRTFDEGNESLSMTRAGRPVIFSTATSVSDLSGQVRDTDPTWWVVISNLSEPSLTRLELPDAWTWMLGVQPMECWLLGIPAGGELPKAWQQQPVRPLGG